VLDERQQISELDEMGDVLVDVARRTEVDRRAVRFLVMKPTCLVP
jgi:hypothetical protein